MCLQGMSTGERTQADRSIPNKPANLVCEKIRNHFHELGSSNKRTF